MANRKKPARPRPPGRPEYRPSLRDRDTVEQMIFCGETLETIARALGISTPTLKKAFPEEITNGHASKQREIEELLFKAARDGNVTALRHLADRGRAAGAAEAIAKRGPRPAQSGKKEQQQAAAEAVADATGSKFAVPASPKLVVSNG